jgi:predicted transcriptional regulator
MEFIDGLHAVLMVAVGVLAVLNWRLHKLLDDANLHLKMAAFTIAALAKGDATIRKRADGEYVITRKEKEA